MANFFERSRSPAFLEILKRGRAWYAEHLPRVIGDGAQVSSPPVERTDLTDGVVFDTYIVHTSAPVSAQRRRHLAALARDVRQTSDNHLLVEIDQRRYDLRWLSSTWSRREQSVCLVAAALIVLTFLFVAAVDHYRTTYLYGESFGAEFSRLGVVTKAMQFNDYCADSQAAHMLTQLANSSRALFH